MAARHPDLSEWKLGWPAAATALLGTYFSVAFIYSSGVFIGPLEAELGWSRRDISFGISLFSFVGAIMTATSGFFADRWGTRWVALTGIAFFSCSILLLTQIGPAIWTWWAVAAFLGFAHGNVSSSVWTSGVLTHFEKSRGAALAVVQLGPALTLATMPIIATQLITAFGWRGAYAAYAALGLCVILPLVALGFWDKRVVGAKGSDRFAQVEGLAPMEILKTLSIWQLAVATIFAVTGLIGFSVHFVPMLVDRGFDRIAAAEIAALIGVGSVIGRISGGVLLDRLPATLVGCVAFSLPALGSCMLLSGISAVPLLSLSAFVLGLSLGAEVDVIAYIAARTFGMRRYSTALGWLVGCTTVGAGLGAWLAGASHDLSGSYQAFQIGAVVTAGASAMLIGTMRRQDFLPSTST